MQPEAGAAITLTRDFARALDPVLLARDVGIEPDEWQADLLRTMPSRALLCCSRQSGKTTATALLALHVAIYAAPALVLLVSPSQRQSAELFRVVMGFHGKLEGAPELNAESVLRAELANGSRILALPGGERTIRGYSAADLLVIDEAARVEDELMPAIRPMLATRSQGRLIALSTPAGKRGWFFESWHGDESWHRVRVPASDCPRISEEFLAEELRELGQMRFSEEYQLAWVDPDECVFPSGIIDAAFTRDVRPLWL